MYTITVEKNNTSKKMQLPDETVKLVLAGVESQYKECVRMMNRLQDLRMAGIMKEEDFPRLEEAEKRISDKMIPLGEFMNLLDRMERV